MGKTVCLYEAEFCFKCIPEALFLVECYCLTTVTELFLKSPM